MVYFARQWELMVHASALGSALLNFGSRVRSIIESRSLYMEFMNPPYIC
jgi:hypothetical protein